MFDLVTVLLGLVLGGGAVLAAFALMPPDFDPVWA